MHDDNLKRKLESRISKKSQSPKHSEDFLSDFFQKNLLRYWGHNQRKATLSAEVAALSGEPQDAVF